MNIEMEVDILKDSGVEGVRIIWGAGGKHWNWRVEVRAGVILEVFHGMRFEALWGRVMKHYKKVKV